MVKHMPKRKRGRPRKPKRSRGRPQGSGIRRTDYPDSFRDIWRQYAQARKKKRKVDLI